MDINLFILNLILSTLYKPYSINQCNIFQTNYNMIMYLLIIHLQAVFIFKQAKSSQEENKKDTNERTAALTCGLFLFIDPTKKLFRNSVGLIILSPPKK